MRKTRKITRNSYKRKVVLFGILVFLSIALISTGFASWVMSQGAKQDGSGNVSVGIVADSNLKFHSFELSTNVWEFVHEEGSYDPDAGSWEATEKVIGNNEFSFNFEPVASDDSGRVRFDGTNYESLFVKIKAVISPEEFIDTVSISLTIPEGIKAAAEANYIILPECAILEGDEVKIKIKVGGETPAGSLKSETTEAGEPTGRAILNYVVEFKWGSKFGYMNPGEYYDSETNGLKVTEDEVKATLEQFRAVVYGYDYNEFVTLKQKAEAAAEQPDNPDVQLTAEEAAKYDDILNPKTKSEQNPNPYVEPLTYKLTVNANIN